MQINAVLEQMEEFRSNRYDSTQRAQYPLGFHTEDFYREEYEFNKKMFSELSQIHTDTLSFDDFISWELLRFNLQNDIKLFEFKEYLNPILSESGFHTNILWRANRTYRTREELENYLVFLKDIPRYFDEHITLMRKGIELGITQPVQGLVNYEATYDPYIVDNPEASIFWKPFESRPENISDSVWIGLKDDARTYISTHATESYRDLKKFFEEEYFTNARTGLGASAIADGKAYYEHKVRYYTTLDMTPDEVHELGKKEVERIRRQMENIIREVGFEGSFEEFIRFLRTDDQFYPETAEDLLKEASWIAKKTDGRLPSLFKTLPRQPYGVVPVPAYLAENYTGGRYSGAPLNSDRGGQYWVNTTKLDSRTLYTLEALTLHEAVPGHHLQIALIKEMKSLPDFRRNMYINAFGEGWGLYAEFLGHELGLYEDPYSLFGRYTYEMWRACRLVIDTGIHYKGWSKEQAVNFLSENSALSMHEVNTEINRYITWPGQALAYKIGELTIKRLRDKAEKELGEKFDVKEFHNVVLSKGTVTMRILEEIVDRYINSVKSG